jgi:transcription antitermination factor NusG
MGEEAWQPGDLVRVRTGSFAELTGTVDQVDAEAERVSVRVAVMGLTCRVELAFHEVERFDRDRRPGSAGRWPRGAPVRVLAGPYQHLVGIVQSSHDQCGRVIVRLAGLQPEVVVALDDEDVESL